VKVELTETGYVFITADGTLLIAYLPNGQTIKAEYYSSLLVHLKDILKQKRCGRFTKRVLFLHDSAPAHWTLATQTKLAYLGFQCLDHPPNSPGLAPSDYQFFPGPKKTIESSALFVRNGGHCCFGHLVGRTTF
jgi:histone-lysine N-methyltransferase SETMAR